MAKIYWTIYILVGLFVSILSWRLNYEKLIFFFYIGLIFIFVGFVKLIFGLIKRKKGTEKAYHKTQQKVKYCSQCGNVMRLHDRFCSRCGIRV